MKKFIFYLILVFTLTTISNAEIVKKINVTGNDRIADETIIVFGAIIKNENYDAKELNDVLRNLYQTDFFSDVKLNLKNNVLNIIVSENPIIQNIVFNSRLFFSYCGPTVLMSIKYLNFFKSRFS